VTRKRPALFRGRHFEEVIILLCVRWYLRYSLTYRDLFSEGEDGVFIQDNVLLESLVAKKLERTANRVRKDGWKWVEIRATFEFEEWSGCQRRHAESVPLSPEQQQEFDALVAELEALNEIEEHDDQQQARSDAINERLDELENCPKVWLRKRSPRPERLSRSVLTAKPRSTTASLSPRMRLKLQLPAKWKLLKTASTMRLWADLPCPLPSSFRRIERRAA
jgi:hypothetical protein